MVHKDGTTNGSSVPPPQYRVRMDYLRTQTLILSMWHHDTFGKNSFLGEVDLDLSTWDFDHTQMNYLALRSRVKDKPLHTHTIHTHTPHTHTRFTDNEVEDDRLY